MIKLNYTNKIYTMLIICLLVTLSTLVNAQERIEVSGKVSDGSGEPLIGVTITIGGTTTGTITDFEGKYKLNVETGSILIFSYIGFLDEQIEFTGQTEIDLTMKQDLVGLDEVVVIGYGSVKKKDLTGAVTQVSSEEFEQRVVSDISEALSGTMAGVQVSSVSGSPGSEAFVSIRGISTINDNGVLWVVDGMPVSSANYLNPQDIESVHVLKDASASAIYGSEAANGVILIETKKGKAGQMKVDVNARYGMQFIAKKPSIADATEYANIQNAGWLNDGGDPNSLPYPDPSILSAGTNWWDEVTQKGTAAATQDYYISINKGEENYNVSTSISYYQQDGVLKGGGYEKLNFRLNTEFKPHEKVRIGENFVLSNQKTKNGLDDWLVWDAQRIEPITSVYLPEYEQEGLNEFSIFAPTITDVGNPAGAIARNFSNDRSLSTVGNLFLEYTPLSFLTFKTEVGIETEIWENQWFSPNYYIEETDKLEINETEHHMGNKFVYNWNNIVTYRESFGNHNISAMGATTTYSDTWKSVKGKGKGMPSNHPDLRYLTATSSGWQANDGSYTDVTKFSYLGRLTYNFSERYLLMASIRRDGSSKFPESNRWATFPSVSAGWIVSEESFIPEFDWLNMFKVRGSWGQIGNDGIPYEAQFSTIANYYYTIGTDQQVVLGKGPEQVGNSNLQWETVEDINFGADIEVYDGKLRGTFDIFSRNTENMLMQKSLLGYMGAGYGRQWANVGSMDTKGWEFDITHKNTIGLWKYNVGVNVSQSRSTMKNVADGEAIWEGNDQRLDMLTYTAENSPIGAFYGYVTNGIFQNEVEVLNYTDEFGNVLQPSAQAGDFKFKDLNGDGRITPEGDRKTIGSPDAKFTYGINLGLTYRWVDFRCLFTGSYGNEIVTPLMAYSNSGIADYNSYGGLNADAWSSENLTNSQPRISNNDPNQNFRYSDYYVSDGSYLRMKSLQLGFTLPSVWANIIKVKTAKLTLNAENIFTITKYKGLDPDIGPYSSNILLRGVDWGNYPLPRTFTVGLNVSF